MYVSSRGRLLARRFNPILMPPDAVTLPILPVADPHRYALPCRRFSTEHTTLRTTATLRVLIPYRVGRLLNVLPRTAPTRRFTRLRCLPTGRCPTPHYPTRLRFASAHICPALPMPCLTPNSPPDATRFRAFGRPSVYGIYCGRCLGGPGSATPVRTRVYR